MADDIIYYERVSSNKTEALFLALTLLFCLLCIWRVNASGSDCLAGIILFFSIIFLFYSVNYRTLVIRLTTQSIQLTFGLFTWVVPLENVEECRLDEIPRLMYLGGAGIHFMTIRNRYRASFNFLEYPRIVIVFKRKRGPVQDLSFSTRQPEQVIQFIQEAASAHTAVQPGHPGIGPTG
jgi:hypothetical protein